MLSSLATLLAVALGLFVAISYLHMAYTWIYIRCTSKEPLLMSWVPWLGVAVKYGLEPKKFLENARDQHGKVFSMCDNSCVLHTYKLRYICGRVHTVVLDPEWHRTFYRAKWTEMLFFEPLKAVRLPSALGTSFVSAKAELLIHVVKTKLQPQYRKVTPQLIRDIKSATNKFMPAPAGAVDLLAFADHLVMLASLRVLCFPLADDADFIEDMKRLEALAHDLLVSPGVLGLRVLWQLRPVRQRLVQRIQRELHRRQSGGDTPWEHDDLLTLISAASDDEELVVDAVVGMMFGAVANTNAALVLSICHIARDHDLKQALETETCEVLASFVSAAKHIDALTDRDVSSKISMPMFDAVLHEVTRMYAILLSLRELVEPVTVHGYNLPQGRTVAISSQLAMRNPLYFPNPDEFQPSRFYRRKGDDPPTQQQYYVGFGAGVHLCKGMELARTEIKIALCHIINYYQLEPYESEDDSGLPKLEWVSLGLAVPTSRVMLKYKVRPGGALSQTRFNMEHITGEP